MLEAINLTIKKPAKSRIFTKEQSLCEEVWIYFKKELPFSRIMRIIKTAGEQKVYQIFSEVKQSDCDNPVALFIFKTKKSNL